MADWETFTTVAPEDQLRYVAAHGQARHWPSNNMWQPLELDDYDLMLLHTHLVRALRKVNAEAIRRGVLVVVKGGDR